MRLGRDIIYVVENSILPDPLAYGISVFLIGAILLQVERESMERNKYIRHLMVMTCGGICGWLFAISMQSYIYRPHEPFVFGLGVFFLIGTALLYKSFFID